METVTMEFNGVIEYTARFTSTEGVIQQVALDLAAWNLMGRPTIITVTVTKASA